jgi:hypothetical protein
MKAEDIVKQMRLITPQYTDKFGEVVIASSATAIGTTVTVVTVKPHELSVGNYVTVSGALSPIAISSLIHTDGVAELVTSGAHDVTRNERETFNPQVEIFGADQPEYNGTYSITSPSQVPNRFNLKELSVLLTAVSPATGQMFLDDGKDRGYNGRVKVTEIVDPNTFKYESQLDLTNSPVAFGDILVNKSVRISASVSMESAQQSYTAQADDNYWAFVVLDDVEVSKSRRIENDATMTHSDGDDFRMQLIMPFSVFVFAPTTKEIVAREARDNMQDEIFRAMNKSLLRKKFPVPVCEDSWSGTTLIGHGFKAFEEAYYIHEYRFEQLAEVTYNDTISNNSDVAFRDICGDIDVNKLDDEIDITLEANLDDQPN